MSFDTNQTCTAFHGIKRIASGDLRAVAVKTKELLERDPTAQPLIFSDATSEVIELDFRGTLQEVVDRIEVTSPDAPSRGPGRPKLGVVAREVTLLPRHWEWLAAQRGGASVALRKLVEHAIKSTRDSDSMRRAQDVTYRFVSAMAGNEPGFEEAIRALFRSERDRFDEWIRAWPPDIRDHAKKLAAAAFPNPDPIL
jgi:hypothetical protein